MPIECPDHISTCETRTQLRYRGVMLLDFEHAEGAGGESGALWKLCEMNAELTARVADWEKWSEPAHACKFYRDVLKEWEGADVSAMGKHVANHPVTIREMIVTLDVNPAKTEAWCRWLVWWLAFHSGQAARFSEELRDLSRDYAAMANRADEAEARVAALEGELEASE